MIRFFCPFPPSVNHAWLTHGKRRFRTKEYLAFENEVASILGGTILYGQSYEVHITLFPSSFRRYDVDNRVKPLLDAITRSGLWDDDSLVLYVTVQKGLPIEGDPVACVEINNTCTYANPIDFGLKPKEVKNGKRKVRVRYNRGNDNQRNPRL